MVDKLIPHVSYSAAKYGTMHTNAASLCPRPCDGVEKDISAAALNTVKVFLVAASTQYRWVNLQGP